MSDDVGERQHESLERWRELLRLDMGELLKLEKRRHGVLEDKLLFVNAANLAGFWWRAPEVAVASQRRRAGILHKLRPPRR